MNPVVGKGKLRLLFEHGKTGARAGIGKVAIGTKDDLRFPGQRADRRCAALHVPTDLASSGVFGDDAGGGRDVHDESRRAA